MSAYDKNSDGWGIMALDDNGEILVAKGVETAEQQKTNEGFEIFYNQYMLEFAHRECAIHFRMRTAGKVDLENAHPYQVDENTWMMHNGIIHVSQPDKDKSDTWHFAQLVKPLTGQLHDEAVEKLLSHACGFGNKLVFLDKSGFTFIHKNEGTYYQECWYSNTYAWNYPYNYSHGYGYCWNDEWVYDGGFKVNKPSRFRQRQQGEFSRNNEKTGQIERGIWLPDGTQVILEQKTAASVTTSNEKISKEKAEEILDAVAHAESTIKDPEELADFMQTNQDNIEKAIQTLSDSEVAQKETNVLVSEKEEEEEEDIQFMPTSMTEWAELNRYQIRRLNYEDPDSIADVLFDLLQGTY